MNKVIIAQIKELKPVEMQNGLLLRRTMSYNKDMMLCHFTLKRGLVLPLHSHDAVQLGYILKGRVKFRKGDGSSFIAVPGTSYIFESNEIHGIEEVSEESEFLECFTPARHEYL